MPHPVSRIDFVAAMSRLAATVNVVTTDGPAGRAGSTVSAMTSVSADGPAPTMLVCLNAGSETAARILENGAFAINVLREDQQGVADAFARRSSPQGGDKFAAARFAALPGGMPGLCGALVVFECRLASAQLVGTHHVIVGEVTALEDAGEGRPLLYAHRAYHRGPAPVAG